MPRSTTPTSKGLNKKPDEEHDQSAFDYKKYQAENIKREFPKIRLELAFLIDYMFTNNME